MMILSLEPARAALFRFRDEARVPGLANESPFGGLVDQATVAKVRFSGWSSTVKARYFCQGELL